MSLKNYTNNFKKECLYDTNYPDKRPIVSISEKNKKFEGTNQTKKTVAVYRIDDCTIEKGTQKQCDYLLLSFKQKTKQENEEQVAYFIELKGSDLNQAVKQIDESLTLLKEKLKGFKINGRIVLSKTPSPNLISTKYPKLKNRLEELGGSLLKNTNSMKENI